LFVIRSSGAGSFHISVAVSGAEGAWLYMHSPMFTTTSNRRPLFKEFMARNAHRILAFARAQKFSIKKQHQLLLINSISRSQDYYAMTFKERRKKQFSFGFSGRWGGC
jgi:hypothetical protein